jgi:hypothetical protein
MPTDEALSQLPRWITILLLLAKECEQIKGERPVLPETELKASGGCDERD